MRSEEQRAYHREYMRAWRERHPGYDKQYQRPENETGYQAAYRERHPERILEIHERYRTSHPNRERCLAHGITTEFYEEMLAIQGGVCAAGCGRPATMIDHDHDHCPGRFSCGWCIRGIVCNGCNSKDELAIDLLDDWGA